MSSYSYVYRTGFMSNIVGSVVESFEQVVLTYEVAALIKILKLFTSQVGSCLKFGWQRALCSAAVTALE